MIEFEYNGGKQRTSAFNKLKVFLANPGKFCLIVLGERGSGKHYAIESAFDEINKSADKELCLKGLKFLDPSEIPDQADTLNKLFKEHQFKTIVIEDVEELKDEQQKLLFKALSTKDGTFGISESYKLRIVFTSSKEIESLRTDNDLLLGFFWDRISQLVVEFPSFKMEGENVIRDFYSTWKKMKFQETDNFKHLGGIPKNVRLESFLEDNVHVLEGGFRDLDKIACLYFNYRIFHYGKQKKITDEIERLVIDSVKDDFLSRSQMKGSSVNDQSVFRFEIGLNHQELLSKYKAQLRRWAVKEYGTISKAEAKLGFGAGTMKNYKEKKIAIKRK